MDLVSRGSYSDKCWGSVETNKTGYGPIFGNSCIHSGAVRVSADLPVTWYSYTLASAGTIFDNNTTSDNPATNTETATENICPKGWTLPTRTQNSQNRNVASFSPIVGGTYFNARLYNESTYGYWWGSQASNGGNRFSLHYNSTGLDSGGAYRADGAYIRCVPAP